MFYNKSSSEFGYFYHFLKDVIYLIKKDQKWNMHLIVIQW
jgi:hypothetical protein